MLAQDKYQAVTNEIEEIQEVTESSNASATDVLSGNVIS